MELKDFIKQTLVSISSAISEVNGELKPLDALANPRHAHPLNEKHTSLIYGYIEPGGVKRIVHSVEFDVAVLASEGKETKGGIGVVVASIALGSQGKSDSSQSSQSRIRFSIPMQYPAGE
ncbi:MAG TPA: hypothetical protein VG722_10505 [Tepidisphaeraceae bacterium]|nr:hypothetical protein [Tepidisphaeraceae bacterium]